MQSDVIFIEVSLYTLLVDVLIAQHPVGMVGVLSILCTLILCISYTLFFHLPLTLGKYFPAFLFMVGVYPVTEFCSLYLD